jgi:hypothetical protein
MKTILLFSGAGEIASLLMIVGICLLIFLAIRAIMLWYWKIDTIVDNQETQIQLLNSILKRLTPPSELTDEEKARKYDQQSIS